MLLSRVITALVALPGLVALILWGPEWAYLIFLVVASLVGHGEMERMVLQGSSKGSRILTVGAGVAFTMAVYALGRQQRWDLFPLLLALTAMGAMTAALLRPGDIKTATLRTSLRLFIFLYVGLLLAFLGLLRIIPHGPELVLLAMVITWSGDTGAYFVGKGLGRHKLYPLVSPGKTVEGAVGGIIASIGGAFLAKALFLPELTIQGCFLAAVPAALLGQVGDLCESLIKRGSGFKDSGKILPGHGGLMDRIDALLFTLPYLYGVAPWILQ